MRKTTKVYICSPMRGDFEKNREKAKDYARFAYKCGCFPICPQIYLEEATGLYESNGDRETLLQLGKEMLKLADEIWVFGETMSSGMMGEVALAEEMKMPIRRFKGI